MQPTAQICLQAVPNIPLVNPGDDLAGLIATALDAAMIPLQDGDILVISSKVVSKAEDRFVDLRGVVPSEHAQTLATEVNKDPRFVELVLQHSRRISRHKQNVLVVTHRLGFTSANAGIDASNIDNHGGDVVLLLPQDPDSSAAYLRVALQARYGVRLGVILSDTHGRPFREGNIGVAIGAAGLPTLIDQRGEADLFGNVLKATITPLADELAAAAGLISGQADEGQPVVLVRGVNWQPSPDTAAKLFRAPENDLYA